ncbi:MAG: flippase activity-associated protein Agl23 [Phycisphaerae bacterium]|nr:flippase activity-associated protein Agl23 [Phycisphaerae bacterium]
MKRATLASAALLAAVGALAIAFRLPRLADRPMHPDEAVQAYKTVLLYETGDYHYDPQEHHGPSLYYLGLVPIRLWAGDAAATDDATLRLVPALFGAGVVLLVWLLRDGLGRPAALAAAFLAAVSPAMVFYSRYYIQEMLLVFFTLLAMAAGWRYLRTRHVGWAILAGLAVGLMHATKETCVIAYVAMAGAAGLVWLTTRGEIPAQPDAGPLVRRRDIALASAVAVLVSVALFTSFFTNASGPIDSLRSYAYLVSRGYEGGIHNHPWHYYLGTLLGTLDGEWAGWRGVAHLMTHPRLPTGPVWTEALILGLALIGAVAALSRRAVRGADSALLKFLVFYTVLATAIYSAVPYKTPWCMLSFLVGMILLAGVGAVALVRWLRRRPLQVAVGVLLLGAAVHLGWQAHRAAFRFATDSRNPYAYAQTYPGVLRVVDRLRELRAVAGGRLVVKVISDENYWPLPWYLRGEEDVGWWDVPPDDADAPVVITTGGSQAAVEAHLGDRYVQGIYGLRPGVMLVLGVRQDLWDAFLASRSETAGPGRGGTP